MRWIKGWWLFVLLLAVAIVIGWQEKRCQAQAHQCRADYIAQLPSSGRSVEQQAAEQQAITAACEPDGYFCRLFAATNLPNVLLVLIGVAGIFAAIKTLRAIEGQVTEMTAQRGVMSGQLTTMQDQLAQMKSSGEQTDRLINETAATAIAAKVSADAAIAADRGWVMVSLEKVPAVGDFISYGPSVANGALRHTAWIRFRCRCINYGKTPAKIIEKRAIAVHVTEENALPDIPNLNIEVVDPVSYQLQAYPGPGQEKDFTLEAEYEAPDGEREMTSYFVVYGVVRYQHLFSKQPAQTTFGYKIGFNGLERLIEHPEYNENS